MKRDKWFDFKLIVLPFEFDQIEKSPLCCWVLVVVGTIEYHFSISRVDASRDFAHVVSIIVLLFLCLVVDQL